MLKQINMSSNFKLMFFTHHQFAASYEAYNFEKVELQQFYNFLEMAFQLLTFAECLSLSVLIAYNLVKEEISKHFQCLICVADSK